MIASWGLLAFLKAADTRQNASFAVRKKTALGELPPDPLYELTDESVPVKKSRGLFRKKKTPEENEQEIEEFFSRFEDESSGDPTAFTSPPPGSPDYPDYYASPVSPPPGYSDYYSSSADPTPDASDAFDVFDASDDISSYTAQQEIDDFFRQFDDDTYDPNSDPFAADYGSDPFIADHGSDPFEADYSGNAFAADYDFDGGAGGRRDTRGGEDEHGDLSRTGIFSRDSLRRHNR